MLSLNIALLKRRLMGFYVNPSKEAKESFLEREGKEFQVVPNWNDVPKGSMIVILVDNGPFTAAGIAFNERELKDFTDPGDRRKKRYFIVPVAKLLDVSGDDFKNYLSKLK